MKITVYANSGHDYGEGHAERCWQLLRAFDHCEVTWLCKQMSARIKAQLPAHFHVVHVVPVVIESEVDAEIEIAKRIEQYAQHSEVLILDDYHINFIRRPKTLADVVIVALDDLANRSIDCDLLVDASPLRVSDEYQTKVPSDCRILCGAQYAIFSDEFDDQPEASNLASINNSVHVFLGSTDPAGMTLPLLRYLLATYPEYQYRAVCTRQTPHLEGIQQLEHQHTKLQVLIEPESLAESLYTSRFAIGAPGTTTWQRMLAGCFCGLLATAENQVDILTELDRRSMIRYLGYWDDFSAITASLDTFFVEYHTLKSPPFDTKGKQRIVQAVCDALGSGQ